MRSGLCEKHVKSLGLTASRSHFLFRMRPGALWQQTSPEPVLKPEVISPDSVIIDVLVHGLAPSEYMTCAGTAMTKLDYIIWKDRSLELQWWYRIHKNVITFYSFASKMWYTQMRIKRNLLQISMNVFYVYTVYAYYECLMKYNTNQQPCIHFVLPLFVLFPLYVCKNSCNRTKLDDLCIAWVGV